MNMSAVVEIGRAGQTDLAGRLAVAAANAITNVVKPATRRARSIVNIEIGGPAPAPRSVSRAGQAEAGLRSPCLLLHLGPASKQRDERVDTAAMAPHPSTVKIGALAAEEAEDHLERGDPARRSEEKIAVGREEARTEREAREMSAKSDSDDRGMPSKPETR